MRFGEDPNVSGTVLISDGVLAGADIAGKENPYTQFVSIRPADVIDRGVYVYRGQFKLGAAAALEHVRAAIDFAKQHNVEGAIREARIAVNLDPNNPEAHALLGDALAATGDTRAAQSEYAAALHSSELTIAMEARFGRHHRTRTRRTSPAAECTDTRASPTRRPVIRPVSESTLTTVVSGVLQRDGVAW